MLMQHRRLLAIPHAAIAAGVAFRLHSFTTPPEEARGAAHAGLWVAIGLLALLVGGFLAFAFGALDPSPCLHQAAGALYAGVTVLVLLDQRHAPIDRQVANLLIFGGLAAAQLVFWHAYGNREVTA